MCSLLFVSSLAAAQGGEVRKTFLSAFIGDEYGAAVAGAGDVDGDGLGDVLVGAPFSSEAFFQGGAAKVYSGATGALIRTLNGTGANHALGLGLSSAGDVNGDGTPDVLVGVPANGSTPFGPGGGAKVYSGETGAALYTFGGTIFSDGFGLTVAGLGDLNADGFDDFIIGTAFSPTASHPGYAKVYSGINGSVLYTKTGTFAGQRFGGPVGYAGDVNGDGVGDFMIGAIGNNVNGANSGSAFVYSGVNGALLYSFHGSAPGNLFGYGVEGVGDLDGDGFGEVLVGTYIPAGLGYARVFSGANGSIMFTVVDGVVGDAFGHTIAGLGDVNGDGTPDFGVAAPNSNVNGPLSGFVRVFSGVDASVIKDFIGPMAGLRYGYSLGTTGDVNGDALTDFVIGTSVVSGSGIAGRALVVSSCAAEQYGVGILPSQTLNASWITGAPGHEAEGGVAVFGAAPNAPGLIVLSLAPAFYIDYGVPVLFDPTPGLFVLFDIVYDANGYFEAPVTLRNPSLAGLSLFTQSFEASLGAPQGFFASNGLAMYFGN